MSPSPSSSFGISFAEEGDVNMALKTCKELRTKYKPESNGESTDLDKKSALQVP